MPKFKRGDIVIIKRGSLLGNYDNATPGIGTPRGFKAFVEDKVGIVLQLLPPYNTFCKKFHGRSWVKKLFSTLLKKH
mgnify:CR=1 FL=1